MSAATPAPGGTRGRFIVVEGIDGAGTTTQARELSLALELSGIATLVTCEPSRGPVGAFVRSALAVGPERPRLDWASLALLFAADRLDHVAREVEPALARGVCVISDRYDLSSLIYQSATAPGGADVLPWIRALNQRARRPDLTLVLDISADVAAQRRHARGGEAELFEELELQRRLAALYARAETFVPGDPLWHVSADAPVAEVTRALVARVLQTA
jgi:dTMP kinase